jgi:ribosome-associated protein
MARLEQRKPVDNMNRAGRSTMRNTMQNVHFALEGEYVELNQLLKLAGLCDSGGAGKMLVASGAVMVDGQPEARKTCKIRTGQVVQVGDVRIQVD